MNIVVIKQRGLARIFQYAKLAMRYTLTHDSRVLGKQAKIRENLGMTDEEIMDEAVRNTDLFKR